SVAVWPLAGDLSCSSLSPRSTSVSAAPAGALGLNQSSQNIQELEPSSSSFFLAASRFSASVLAGGSGGGFWSGTNGLPAQPVRATSAARRMKQWKLERRHASVVQSAFF